MNPFQEINISDLVFRQAVQTPEKAAVLHPKRTTYKLLCKRIDSFASSFLKTGIKAGDRSVVLIKPGTDMVAVVLALVRIGAIPVLIDPGMGIGALTKALARISPSALVGSSAAMCIRYLWPQRMSDVRIWISSCQLKAWKNKKPDSYQVYKASPGEQMAVFFTSGSTGPAKAVEYTSEMIGAQLELLKKHFGYQTDETDLCTYPLIGFFSICLGLSVVFADFDFRNPLTLDPQKLLDNLKDHKCTLMFCSPLIIRKLRDYLRKTNQKITGLNHLITAGAAVSYSLIQEFQSKLSVQTQWHIPFGATEALPICDVSSTDILNLEDARDSANGVCIGYPLEGIDVRIIPVTDEAIEDWSAVPALAVGKVGEIVVAGENVSARYVQSQKANALAKIRDEESNRIWHRMGDLGRIDPAGRLWFYGRKSQRLELGEKTLFTVPVEAVFDQHEYVERSALVGIQEHDKLIAVVAIQLKKGRKKSKRLLTELGELAARYVITRDIKRFYFLKSFPVDPRHNAKIFREKIAKWIQRKVK